MSTHKFIIVATIAVVFAVGVSGLLVISTNKSRANHEHSQQTNDPASAEAIRHGLLHHHD